MKIITSLIRFAFYSVSFILSFWNNEWNANIFVQAHFRGTDCKLSDSMKFPSAVLSQVFASVYAFRVSVAPIVRRFYFCSFFALSPPSRRRSVSDRVGEWRGNHSASLSLNRYFNGEWTDPREGRSLYVSARHEIGKWNSHRPLILSRNVERRMTLGHARVFYICNSSGHGKYCRKDYFLLYVEV